MIFNPKWIRNSEVMYRYFVNKEEARLSLDLLGDGVVEKSRWAHRVFDELWYATIIVPGAPTDGAGGMTRLFFTEQDAKKWVEKRISSRIKEGKFR